MAWITATGEVVTNNSKMLETIFGCLSLGLIQFVEETSDAVYQPLPHVIHVTGSDTWQEPDTCPGRSSLRGRTSTFSGLGTVTAVGHCITRSVHPGVCPFVQLLDVTRNNCREFEQDTDMAREEQGDEKLFRKLIANTLTKNGKYYCDYDLHCYCS